MKSHRVTVDTRSRNFGITFICLGIVLFAVTAPLAQQLRKGVSVQMAQTSHAKPMPAADEQDAWVVSVTADGKLFFGAEPVPDQGLADVMIRTPHRRDQGIYIKADARATYENVEKALKAAHTMQFDQPVLLTAQPEPTRPGTIVAPKGLAVSLQAGVVDEPLVEIEIEAGQGAPALRVNSQQTAWENLPQVLTQSFQGRSENVVRLEADGAVPFAYLVRVIDASSVQAKVILVASASL